MLVRVTSLSSCPSLEKRRGDLVHTRRHGEAHAPVRVEVSPGSQTARRSCSPADLSAFASPVFWVYFITIFIGVGVRLAGEREPRDRFAV